MKHSPLDEHYRLVDERIAEALEGIKEAVKQINDTNVLHAQMVKDNTVAILSIKEFWGTIVKWLIIALIVLAGGEKVIKLLGMG